MTKFEPFRHLAYMQDLRSRLNKPLRYNLSDSGCEPLSFSQLHAMDEDYRLDELSLGYASVQGAPELRQGIARQYGCDADQVATFCGAQEALFALFNHLLKPGDEVINFAPAYPSILSLPKQLGCEVKSINLSFDNLWQIDIADIQDRLSDKTRAIVINSPHNPTGSVITKQLAEQIVELARSRGIYIISDEVSVWSDYNDLDLRYPFLAYEKGVVVGVLSKSIGLGGVRIGWAICQDQALLQSLMNIRGYLSICGSVTDEQLATIAFSHFDTIIGNNNAQIKANIALFRQFIEHSNGLFEWLEPQAGILTLVKSNLPISIRELAEQLAVQAQLLILPGDLFGIEGNYFRLGLGRAGFAEALEQFKRHIETFLGSERIP